MMNVEPLTTYRDFRVNRNRSAGRNARMEDERDETDTMDLIRPRYEERYPDGRARPQGGDGDPRPSNMYRDQRRPEVEYQSLFGRNGERIPAIRGFREPVLNEENVPGVVTIHNADNQYPHRDRDGGHILAGGTNPIGRGENPYFRAVPGAALPPVEGGRLTSRPLQQRPTENSARGDRERPFSNTERSSETMNREPANRSERVRDWVSDQQHQRVPEQRRRRMPSPVEARDEEVRIHRDEEDNRGGYRSQERRAFQEIIAGVPMVRPRGRTTSAERPSVREEEARQGEIDQIWNFRRRVDTDPSIMARRFADRDRARTFEERENPIRGLEGHEFHDNRRDWYNREYVAIPPRRLASSHPITNERRDGESTRPYPSDHLLEPSDQYRGGTEHIRRVHWATDDRFSITRGESNRGRRQPGPYDDHRYSPANRDYWPIHHGSGSSLPMPKPVPVNRWKIYFSGEVNLTRNELSIHDFLAQVDMFRRSEGIHESEMIRQIIHLLRGSASLWYQTVYHSIQSWAEFVLKLKAKFLPNDYTFSLLSEIERRKQGESEPVGLYISDMERKFRAMPLPFDELHRVYYIRRNLQSRLRTWIASADASTVSELEAICKRAEANGEVNAEGRVKAPAKIWNQPRRRDGRVEAMYTSDYSEPEEEHRGSTESIHEILGKRYLRPRGAEKTGRMISRGTQSGSSNEMICYNCSGRNHGWRDCKEEKKGIFCYLCGQKDAMVDDGHTCSKNGQGGSVNPAGPKKTIQ